MNEPVYVESNGQKKESDFIDIDSTENIRTVIVNKEFQESDVERYQINIDWTVKQLNDFFVEKLGL